MRFQVGAFCWAGSLWRWRVSEAKRAAVSITTLEDAFDLRFRIANHAFETITTTTKKPVVCGVLSGCRVWYRREGSGGGFRE